MQLLTSEGLRVVTDLSKRHGFSVDAITHLLLAMVNGNGTMAQFNHPEFTGSGQWMQGGMIMLGDMFNNTMKGRVNHLCQMISTTLVEQPGILFDNNRNLSKATQASDFTMGGVSWWPSEFGSPNATGSQNNMRYAYFSSIRRLVVETNLLISVYDTRDHQINGIAQQQGMDSSIVFSSQNGSVRLESLLLISTLDSRSRNEHTGD